MSPEQPNTSALSAASAASAGAVAPAAISANLDLRGLTVSAVARRLGVAPSTLRTWDRRYGLGPSAHSDGSHRRYSEDDVARLDRMQVLVHAGVGTAEAARLACASECPVTPSSSSAQSPIVTAGATADASRLVRGLTRACAALDERASAEILRESVSRRGAIWTWQEVLVPVLQARGRTWERTGAGIEVEHLLSSVVTREFSALASPRHPVNSRPVLLACAPWDDHTLPLYAVGAALAERGVASRMLGARTPQEALAAAVRKIGPSSVLVWASVPGPDAHWLTDLGTQRPAPAVFVGGPGWPEEVPSGVKCFDDLPTAVVGLAHRAP